MKDVWAYGLSITVIGMGGTLISLWFLSAVMVLLKRLFPYRETENAKQEKK